MGTAKLKKALALSLAAVMTCTSTGWAQSDTASKVESSVCIDSNDSVLSTGGDNQFSWDNATVYFLLTDRFKNGNTGNDNAYGRQNYNFSDKRATFHGGDFAGITEKIEDGYFDDLGVNAIWLSAPYEQIHGYIQGGKDNGKGYFHQSYHGYYVLDYTETDAAFGTKEEFKELVTKAHEHGIRIVMDIVMNHTGYNSMGDMNEFNFGILNSGWKDYYDRSPENDYDSYHNYIDYNNGADKWGNWWGSSWVRSGLPGYTSGPDVDANPLLGNLQGLPDFKTESGDTVSIPGFLQSKWKNEGTYDSKISKYGSTGTVRSYLVKWLTEWVEEFGVDGFRCDTAKHVENESWNALKTAGVASLKKWRQNNPTAPGADWTDDFWMTGEAFDHEVVYDNYYTSGGFDSMINFAIWHNESIISKSKLESTYSSYANSINSNSKFNVLSFMSSHDATLMSNSHSASDMYYYGTAFLMLPGGVQIFYGDETYRGMVPGAAFDGDGKAGHSLRSDMNWSTMDKNLLAHWQKVGKFRNNHVSVGAGTHKQISSAPYTFSRIKDDDKVVVSMPDSAGTYDINVSTVFDNGVKLKDAYSGEAYTVKDGKVSVTCDSNCTILLEENNVDEPYVKASGSSVYSTETVKVTLNSKYATDTYYSVNGGEKKAFTDGDTIEIGGGTAYEEAVKVTVTGTAQDGSKLNNTATFTRCMEPVISDDIYRLKVKKSEYTTCPNIYVWQDGVVDINGVWPGALMTDDGDYWTYENAELTGTVKFILSYGKDNKLTDDLSSTGSKIYTNGEFEDISVGNKAKVTAKYVDKDGNDLTGGKDVYRVGAAGTAYEIAARDIDGYTLEETEGKTTGLFTEDEVIVVTFKYKKNGGEETTTPVETTTGEETTSPVETTTGEETTSQIETTTGEETTSQIETTTGEEKTTPVETTTGEETTSQKETTTVTETTTPVETTSQKETTTGTETTTPVETTSQKETTTGEETTTVEPTTIEPTTVEPVTEELKITDISISKESGIACVGDSIAIKAVANGGKGTLKYKFTISSSWDDIIRNYKTSDKAVWKATESGKYTITVWVKDEAGTVVSETVKNFVVNGKLKVSSFKTKASNGKVKLTAKAKGGSGVYLYRFAYKKGGTSKVVYTNSFKKKNTATWKPSKAGTYKLYVYVKDVKTGKVVKKILSGYKVKKSK